jgi:hypothetical protein
MDSMFCPYYRIPELHCEPLEMKSSLLWDLVRMISTTEEADEMDRLSLASRSAFETVCKGCEFLTKKHRLFKGRSQSSQRN